MTKVADLQIVGNKVYYRLNGCSNDEFVKIIEYKSWTFRSWTEGNVQKYFSFVYLNRDNEKIIWSYVGFSPILIRYLQSLGYLVNGKELYRSKEILIGDTLYKPYDFQSQAINSWLNNGCVGIIKSPTGCITGDSIIYTNKGLITIKEMYNKRYRDIKVMNYNGDEIQYNEINDYYHHKDKDILLIRTRFGFEMKCTPEHKVVCIDKTGMLVYMKAKDLKAGMVVPISYGYACFGENSKMRWDEGQMFIPGLESFSKTGEIKSKYGNLGQDIIYPYYMNENLAEFLGYYISEGNLTDNWIQISNTDEKINSRVQFLSKELFNCDSDIISKDGKDCGRIILSRNLVEFFYKLKLNGKSRDKHVPIEILKSSKEVHISFLKALYSGDGYIEKDKSDVGYNSMSKNLCRHVQIMLLNLGIFSTLTEKDSFCDEKYCGKTYTVTIYGNNVLKFKDVIGFTLDYRQNDLIEACKKLENTDRWTTMVIPNIHLKIKELDDIARKKKYIYVRHVNDTIVYSKFLQLYGFKGINMWCDGRRFPSKNMLKRILSLYSNIPEALESSSYKYLTNLCDLNVEYDSIECIEKREKEDVYDLTIKNVPNYVSNGYIVHNSGKSFLSCKVIQKMKVKTLILVHTNDLFSVWLNVLIQQFGNGIKSQIGIVGGRLSKNDRKQAGLVSDTSYDSNIKMDIVIATSQSLLNRLDRLCNERFGLVITDECHHYSSEQFSKVASNVRAPYRLGLTATENRPDGTSPLFHGLLGDTCFRINIRELVNKRILVNPIFNTIIINDNKIQSDISTCGLSKLDLSRYVKQKSASSTIKVKYILNLVRSLCNNGKCFVMYTDYVNNNVNGTFTRDFYVQELNKAGIRVIGVSSDMSGGERQKVFSLLESKKLDGIIFGSLGSEGVDIPRIDSVIMCNATKSPIRYTQRVGRSMRVVKNDNNKVNAYIYEIVLETPMERRWSQNNFLEYEQEGYTKEIINIR